MYLLLTVTLFSIKIYQNWPRAWYVLDTCSITKTYPKMDLDNFHQVMVLSSLGLWTGWKNIEDFIEINIVPIICDFFKIHFNSSILSSIILISAMEFSYHSWHYMVFLSYPTVYCKIFHKKKIWGKSTHIKDLESRINILVYFLHYITTSLWVSILYILYLSIKLISFTCFSSISIFAYISR